MDSLPPYMKIIYQELLNIYDEAEEVLAKEGKSNSVIYYAKNEVILNYKLKRNCWHFESKGRYGVSIEA